MRHKPPGKPSSRKTSVVKHEKQRRWPRSRTLARTFTSCSTNLHPPPRTGATVFFSCPFPIHSGSGPETSYQCFTARRRISPVRRPFAARRQPLSRADLFKPRSLPARGGRTRTHFLVRQCVTEMGRNPSPLSSLLFVSGTTRRHANEAATALQRSSLDSHPLLLAGHSQTGLLKHQGDLFPGTGSTTPGRHNPSQLSCDLHLAAHVPRGCYPSGLFTVCPSLPARHSFHRRIR